MSWSAVAIAPPKTRTKANSLAIPIYRWAASYGHSKKEHDQLKEYVLTLAFLPGRGSALERALLEARPVQIADVAADPEYTRHGIRRVGAYRTVLSAPLLREGLPIGAMVLTRSQPRTFSDRQVDLLVTFADQAVIAIENIAGIFGAAGDDS